MELIYSFLVNLSFCRHRISNCPIEILPSLKEGEDFNSATFLQFRISGSVEEVENPRWLKKQLENIARTQQRITALETAAKAKSAKDKHFRDTTS